MKDSIEALTLYFGANAESLCFPELVVPVGVLLRKFKKHATNGSYRKAVQSFLDLLKRNEDFVAQERARIKDKALKDPAHLFQQFKSLVKDKEAPLRSACRKIEQQRSEQMQRKLD